MANMQSFIKKYGQTAGELIYKYHQKEAAHARWKDAYLKKLKACQAKVKTLETALAKAQNP